MPDVLTRVQWLSQRGYCTKYDISDDGAIGSMGRASKHTIAYLEDALLERIASHEMGCELYQQAIDEGKVFDPTREFKPTPANETPQAKRAQARIGQLENIIGYWRRLGISSKTGKLRPKYCKQIALAEQEIERLQPIANPVPPA